MPKPSYITICRLAAAAMLAAWTILLFKSQPPLALQLHWWHGFAFGMSMAVIAEVYRALRLLGSGATKSSLVVVGSAALMFGLAVVSYMFGCLLCR
jgi:hypothetical protein